MLGAGCWVLGAGCWVLKKDHNFKIHIARTFYPSSFSNQYQAPSTEYPVFALRQVSERSETPGALCKSYRCRTLADAFFQDFVVVCCYYIATLEHANNPFSLR